MRFTTFKTASLQRLAIVASITLTSIGIATISIGCDLGSSSDDEVFIASEIEALATRHGPRDRKAESRKRGQVVYSHFCAICHGDKGGGNGFNSSQLAQKPRNFTESEFRKNLSRASLIQTISKGGAAVGKSNLMPAWGNTLSHRQIEDLATYIGSLPKPEGQEVKEPEAK